MDLDNLKELLELDKGLVDFAHCMQMATRYKKYNFAYHSLIRQRVEKEVREVEEENE